MILAKKTAGVAIALAAADAQPLLAICVYHKPEDLWELPLLISEINPNYDMHLRVHSHMGLSTVLYCVPR
ncbi:MAG TPA: hypothetical protein PKZ35_12640 [Gammaproteobacteria bacterium]|nr:hypothetical protein [Chromatiaceae bacterium]HPE80842.1 hypothetical protein [Gammaproteobacteria bacterium]